MDTIDTMDNRFQSLPTDNQYDILSFLPLANWMDMAVYIPSFDLKQLLRRVKLSPRQVVERAIEQGLPELVEEVFRQDLGKEPCADWYIQLVSKTMFHGTPFRISGEDTWYSGERQVYHDKYSHLMEIVVHSGLQYTELEILKAIQMAIYSGNSSMIIVLLDTTVITPQYIAGYIISLLREATENATILEILLQYMKDMCWTIMRIHYEYLLRTAKTVSDKDSYRTLVKYEQLVI